MPLIPKDPPSIPPSSLTSPIVPHIQVDSQALKSMKESESEMAYLNISNYAASEASLALTERTNSSATLLKTLEMTAMTKCQKVKVKSKGKSKIALCDLYLIQQLTCPGSSTVYCLQVSPDGTYLAAGCADGVIRIWELLSKSINRELEIDPELVVPRTAAIFNAEPLQVLLGHEAEVLDLSWSTVL